MAGVIAMLGVATLAMATMRSHSARASSGVTAVGSCAGRSGLTCSTSHSSPYLAQVSVQLMDWSDQYQFSLGGGGCDGGDGEDGGV
jgi:hypothetical protein